MVRILRNVLLLSLPLILIASSSLSPPTARAASPDPFGVEIGPVVHRLGFFEDDMDGTYGGMFTYGLKLAWSRHHMTRQFFSMTYGQKSGDPFYDITDFEGTTRNRLRAVQWRLGTEVNVTNGERFRIYLGMAAEFGFMQERQPEVGGGTRESMTTYDGWGFGLVGQLTGEWRSADLRRAVGLGVYLGGSGTEVEGGYRRHDVDLSAYGITLYSSMRL